MKIPNKFAKAIVEILESTNDAAEMYLIGLLGMCGKGVSVSIVPGKKNKGFLFTITLHGTSGKDLIGQGENLGDAARAFQAYADSPDK